MLMCCVCVCVVVVFALCVIGCGFWYVVCLFGVRLFCGVYLCQYIMSWLWFAFVLFHVLCECCVVVLSFHEMFMSEESWCVLLCVVCIVA